MFEPCGTATEIGGANLRTRNSIRLPWGYPSIDHLTNWRLYSKYSHGMMAELCSHQVHVINWFTGAVPQAVVGTGGIYRYKDGREVNDHIYTIFEYPKNLTLTYSAIQSNAFDHYYEEFMGTKGTIVLSGETEALAIHGRDSAESHRS